MPPGVNRYNPSGISNTFQHLHTPHLQHHPSQQHGPSAVGGPPNLGGHPNYNAGNPSSNINPFALGGNNGLGAFGGAGAAALAGGGGTGLASHAAQMGFAHGAALQQQQAAAAQQAQHDTVGVVDGGKGAMKGRIRDVWKHNLAQEMAVLRNLVEKYPYISMDTEFPGIVARPMGDFRTKAEYHYQTLRCNVDLLRMIQLGITLFSADGELPPAHAESTMNGTTYQNNLIPTPCTWQFNFRFSLMSDMYAQDSIELLQKAGINFDMHEKNGIDPQEFGALLISSGLVLLDDVKWISFHSGYDFGYLMKQMLCKPLPDDEEDFRKLLNIFFPSIYDIKFLMKHALRNQAVNNSPLSHAALQIFNNLGQKSSLQDIAEELGIKRVGNQHQAGSDSLVTGRVFWEVRRVVFNGNIDDEKYLGQIWGLNGVGAPASATLQGHQTPNLNGATIYSNGGTPSTPNTGHAGLASATPGPHGQSGAGSLTPGGGGGVFGGFQFTTKA